MHFSIKKFLPIIGIIACFMPSVALADWGVIDSFNLAPFVPIVLDAFMMIATGGYEFFVGNGDGIIYLLIWGFLAVSMALYAVKMFLPKVWVSFAGFSGGGEMADGTMGGMSIAQNMMRPVVRAIIAATILLQIKPIYMTEFLVNPFLQFGALYTHSITETINDSGNASKKLECPDDILSKGWISKDSCEFLIQPVSDLSHANNQVIKRGFDFINRGLRGLITLIPHGGEDFLNIVTGVILVFTFVASNVFMALLIIQAIFDFGMALILYPFNVLAYVAKPSDKWLDIWPAFSGITRALQRLVITMIACAFILCINIAIIKALFRWNTSVFVVAAGGSSYSNVPQIANSAMGFGQHSILWLSAILTFYVMFKIFDITRNQLMEYVGSGMDNLHKQVVGDAKTSWNKAKTFYKWVKKVRK